MDKKIILPFEDNPYTTVYQTGAFPMGIIQANAKDKDIIPWLCGKFINYRATTSEKFQFYINEKAHGWQWDNIILRERLIFLPDVLYSIFGDIVELLKQMLAQGRYVYGFFNEEYIPGKINYKAQYFRHDFLLIGYDENEQVFHSVGYLRDQRFERFDIPIDNMRMSLKTLKDPTIALHFWRYNPEASYILNIKDIIRQLNDYLCGTSSIEEYTQDKVWGIDALRQLCAYFERSAKKNELIDYRFSRAIMEHKFFMKLRIEYLLKNNYIGNAEWLDYAERIYKKSEICHMLTLKHLITKDRRLIDALCKNINEIIVQECEYLYQVLIALQKIKEI